MLHVDHNFIIDMAVDFAAGALNFTFGYLVGKSTRRISHAFALHIEHLKKTHNFLFETVATIARGTTQIGAQNFANEALHDFLHMNRRFFAAIGQPLPPSTKPAKKEKTDER